MADVKLFLSCVSDEFGDYRDALRRALTRPNVEIKIQEDFQNRSAATRSPCWKTTSRAATSSCISSGDMAGSAPASTQRRRSFAAPARACGSAGRKGHGPRGAWAPDLHAMGSVARDRLQQGRREEEPRHRRAGVWRETRRKIRADGRFARVAGRSSRAAEGDRLLSREAIHQRRQSGRACLRVRWFWTPSKKARDRSRSPAICPSHRSAACSPAATRTLPTCIRRCSAPRARRSRFAVSGGSARRGSRSNMRGLARRSIRRFCSSARATAPRSTRVWRG